MANGDSFNVYELWREVEKDPSMENMQRAYKKLLLETKSRKMSEQEMQVFYFLDARVKRNNENEGGDMKTEILEKEGASINRSLQETFSTCTNCQEPNCNMASRESCYLKRVAHGARLERVAEKIKAQINLSSKGGCYAGAIS
ncbi:MAG: hypothetical protein PHP62_04005 [Candidatus Moranbacteria bacterium]|nr:hypothetical protein [Candidatus Moranbacteria bacterium]